MRILEVISRAARSEGAAETADLATIDHAIEDGRRSLSARGLGKYEITGPVVKVSLDPEDGAVVASVSGHDMTPERMRRIAFAVLALSDRVETGQKRP